LPRIKLDAPARGFRFVNGPGGRRKMLGAKQRKKLLLLREVVIESIQKYADERGVFFNHALEELVTIGVKYHQYMKKKEGR